VRAIDRGSEVSLPYIDRPRFGGGHVVPKCGGIPHWNHFSPTYACDRGRRAVIAIGDVDSSRVVRIGGDTVAGNQNSVPKCAVRNDFSEVRSIGLFGGGGRTVARNENRVPKCTWGRGLLP